MDLIKRKQAIKAIENLQDCYNGFSDTYDKACIIGVLEELPSAEKTGRWVFIGEYICIDGFMNSVWKCNQCGWKVVDDSNYCPNCGARMEE